jgi:glycosyltransferase involved in cell wall biosynthesis
MTSNGRLTVLNVFPHPGGGAERMVDVLERVQPDVRHERVYLSPSSEPVAAAPAIPRRWPGIVGRAAQADIVHAHGDMAAMLVVPLLAGRPSAMSTHGLSFLRRAKGSRLRAARRGMGTVMRTASRTVCTSATEMHELERIVGPGEPRRLRLILNGVPVPDLEDGGRERQDVRRELGVEDDLVGVFLGGLEPHKDPITAARAARLARDRGVRFTLLVAGEGSLASAIATEGGEAVRVLGFRDDPERLLRGADVFLMTSQREAVSCALLEAMSFGVAAIASDARGNPEGLGQTGLMVPVGDAHAFAESIVRLAEDPEERLRLGAAGRARVLEHFTADRLARQMDAVYAEVLAESLRR